MQTTFLTNGGSSAANDKPASNSSATSDMFTKLLVAQLQNQDPLAPTDPSEIVNQMAQMSQTESLQNLANLTSANASVLQSLQILALGAQVGSSVTALSDHVNLAAQPVSGVIMLSSASASTKLTLTAASGQKHEIELGSQVAGEVPFTIDPAALGLPPGRYTIEASAGGGAAQEVALTGKLNGVKLSSSGGVVLDIAGVGEVTPDAVTGFNGQSPLAASN